MLTALILFFLTYVLMIALPKQRYLVAVCSAIVFVILGIQPLSGVGSAKTYITDDTIAVGDYVACRHHGYRLPVHRFEDAQPDG